MKTENLVYNIQNFQTINKPKGKMREQINDSNTRPVFRGSNVYGYDNFEMNKIDHKFIEQNKNYKMKRLLIRLIIALIFLILIIITAFL